MISIEFVIVLDLFLSLVQECGKGVLLELVDLYISRYGAIILEGGTCSEIDKLKDKTF